MQRLFACSHYRSDPVAGHKEARVPDEEVVKPVVSALTASQCLTIDRSPESTLSDGPHPQGLSTLGGRGARWGG